MNVATWVDDAGTVYVLRGDSGPYQAVTESGEVSERFSLPSDADLIGEMVGV